MSLDRGVPPSPSSYPTLEKWADATHTYLTARQAIKRQNIPEPIQLVHKLGSGNIGEERAITEGILLYDPVAQTPVVSVNGKWYNLHSYDPSDGYITYYESPPLAAPIVVEEGGPPTTLSTLTIAAPTPGIYRVSGGIVATFVNVNDQLHWRATGSLPTIADFIIEGRADDQREPFYFSFTVELDGTAFSTTMEAEVLGPGQASVTVDTADAFMMRIGE